MTNWSCSHDNWWLRVWTYLLAKELCTLHSEKWRSRYLRCLREGYRNRRILLWGTHGIWVQQRGENDYSRLHVSGKALMMTISDIKPTWLKLTTFPDGRPNGSVHGIQPAVIHWDRLLGHIQVGSECPQLRYSIGSRCSKNVIIIFTKYSDGAQ